CSRKQCGVIPMSRECVCCRECQPGVETQLEGCATKHADFAQIWALQGTGLYPLPSKPNKHCGLNFRLGSPFLSGVGALVPGPAGYRSLRHTKINSRCTSTEDRRSQEEEKIYKETEKIYKMFEHLAEQTNLYCVQKSGKSTKTDIDEMEQFVRIFLMTGLIPFPQYHFYWSHAVHLINMDSASTPRPEPPETQGANASTFLQEGRPHRSQQLPDRFKDYFVNLYDDSPMLKKLME
ncbi:hypothetical protein HPB47_024713, partial [Ixodes persulcatus]